MEKTNAMAENTNTNGATLSGNTGAATPATPSKPAKLNGNPATDALKAKQETLARAFNAYVKAMAASRSAGLPEVDKNDAKAVAARNAQLAIIAQVAEIDAIHEFVYAFPIDTRVQALCRIVETGNDLTGPYKATVRLGGLEWQLEKSANGPVTLTPLSVAKRDKTGRIIEGKPATYTPAGNPETVADAYTNIGHGLGRVSKSVAVAANLVAKVAEPKESKPARERRSAEPDPAVAQMAAQMAAMQSAMAEQAKVNAALLAAVQGLQGTKAQ